MDARRRPSGWRWSDRSAAIGAAVLMSLVVVAAPAVADDAVLHVPVLMYHRIKSAPPDARLPELWVAPRDFRAQLHALARDGWRTITAEELATAALAGRSVGPKRFVITIDDGAWDGYRYAAPAMERYGMRATYCVVPGRAQRPWQISIGHLVELHEAGHEIANHSLLHADLPRLGAAALRRQVGHARRLIERYVGEAPATLCYPYGHQDARVRRVVARTGHLVAFTTVEGAAQPPATRFRWPRIRVDGSDSPATLLARLQPFAKGGGREPGPRGDRAVRLALPRPAAVFPATPPSPAPRAS
jgi:peptidoglycan/xylan/chitin deacetylase (PgdA/CDA1 family)